MKRIILLCWLLCISIPVYAADTELFTKEYTFNENFTIDNIQYSLTYVDEADTLYIKSDYSEFLVDRYGGSGIDCKVKGYYMFCLVNVSVKEWARESRLILKAVKRDPMNYTHPDKGIQYKKAIGEWCDIDIECASDKCLHGICTFTYPLCGDKYCHDRETCEKDCVVTVNVSSTNPFIIEIPVDSPWIETNYTLQAGVEYMFVASGSYTLDKTNTKYDVYGRKNYSKYAPCPEKALGSIVLDICGTCYAVNETVVPEEDCSLRMRVNENRIEDNTGKVTVEVQGNFVTGDIIETPVEIQVNDSEVMVAKESTKNSTEEKDVTVNETVITPEEEVTIEPEKKSPIFILALILGCFVILGILFFIFEKIHEKKQMRRSVEKMQEQIEQ